MKKKSLTMHFEGKAAYVPGVYANKIFKRNCKRCIFRHCGFRQMEVCGAGRDGHFESLYIFNLVEKE
jgi:hypothetical protein